MLESFRKARGRFALLPLFMLYLSACTVTQHIELSAKPKLSEIVGLTSRSGQTVAFDPRGAVISHDILYAVGPQGQVILPTDSIQNVWVKQVSPARTIGLVAVLGAVLYGFVVLANHQAGSASTTNP